VAESVVGFLRDNETRNVSDGEKSRTRRVLGELVKLFGRSECDEFRARRLQQLRRHFTLELGWNFKHTRDAERRVRKWVSWCVTEELVSFQTAFLLDQVPRLAEGEYGTTTSVTKDPVELDQFRAVVPYLAPSIADFARVQFLCGMRPGEVARLKGREAIGNREHAGGEAPVWLFDGDHEVWLYRFDDHKCRRKTRAPLWKAVPAAALGILERHLAREDETTGGTGWLLRPSVVKAERDASRPPRKTPLTIRNRLQRARVARTYDPERDCYSYDPTHPSRGYSQAIRLAVKKAVQDGALSAPWAPNQLRHGVATFLAKTDGLQAARLYLGHADERTTRTHYAPESTAELARVSRVVNEQAAAWLA